MDKKYLYKTPECVAVLSGLLCGIAAHAFALVNVLHNYDNILQQPKGYGAGVTSGRWLLTVLGDFCAKVLDLNYNLPTINGLAYLALIALSAAFVVNVLKIHSRVSAGLVGALMATFPTVCSTMVFRFTAAYYGLSLLFSVMAVKAAERTKYGWILSGLCIACSMGIYQAYVPVSISLYVLILMREALEEDAQLNKLIQHGLYCCTTLILGVVLYFLFLKICLAAYGVELDTYQGINSMGKLSLSELPWLLKKTWLSAALFPVKDYCNLASTRILKLIWTALVGMILILALYLLVKKKPKRMNALFFILMGIVFPLAINFIAIMCPDGIVYTIMVYPFVLVACAPLLFLDCLLKNEKKFFWKLAVGLLATIIFYNSYYSNCNYTALYYSTCQMENYVNSLVTQIRMTDGFSPDKKWGFIGTIDDSLLYDIWSQPWDSDQYLVQYGGMSITKRMLAAKYSFNSWIYSYVGYFPAFVSEETQMNFYEDDRVEQMPCWPAEGSIKVIDDIVVVKFQECE